MAKFSKNIEFTFIEPPEQIIVDPEDESTLPTIKVDVSSSDSVLQALLLRILPLIKLNSQEYGAEYVFEVKE